MVHPDAQDERRLTAKGRATRDRIVQTAAQLIVTEGLSAANMDKVRKAASVSGSQLAHYFADKGALIREVIKRQIAVVLDFHRQPSLGDLDSFDDFERWLDLNMRYLRRIGTSGGTPTYHALAAQLAKSDDTMRATLAAGYWDWAKLLESAILRMKGNGALMAGADARRLALVIIAAHQGGGTMAFTYRAEWPHADATRFAVNYLRMFATDPDERTPRPVRRPRHPARKGNGRNMAGDSKSRFTPKGQATRNRIITAAAELMFERGVANTSIEEVRRAAGVGGSQISHYFRDKRELTREVIAARRDDVIEFHTQPRLATLDSIETLQTWAEACIDDIDTVYRLGGCVYGSLAGELIEADHEVRDDLAYGYDRWLELFRTGLTTMRQRGELRPEADPRHLAASLVIAHQGGAMITHATGDAEPLRVAVTAAVDYVRSFIAGTGERRPSRRRRKP
ncbi:TetR/AcrR family transcriptional regulator [Mycobacterium sherrisii]|uniref:TetR family transcriptional regulator n=1 Tax=Mycobacterium sherrisii TaxID=243061 RepID=A0A1E3SPE2_9MYCO|nr:TetR/AcrR family transcriptional regulator [Mycobacterium sherrisii]MCV7027762.1 TetR/AcrR family transcriptional regulator [Mycobacterium sherrisii]ODR04027.1 TetR family transcriptional regulator [Mycobacterium sherrisii]ORW84438.1 TetR family transcriptional regulator [Mycobacterium sherrisii]